LRRLRWRLRWIPFSLSWDGKPLAELSTDKSKWRHSNRLFELEVVFEWHRLPSEFGLCEPDYDLTLMAAYIIAKRKMEGWEMKVAQREARRNAAHHRKRR
jgi:hypothetical protein